MTAAALTAAPSAGGLRLAGKIALGALGVALAWRLLLFAQMAARAIGYRFELDYGEGIVWQQMRWLFTDKAYGAIDGFPAIVFHYTPAYHALVALVAGVGFDELAAGRTVSIAATVAVAVASALIVDRALRPAAPRVRLICALIGAGLVFANWPVIVWAPLMRVDMLALALSFAGFYAAIRALERPAFIYAAALAFVLAVYTKQTSIAAPAAAFSVLLFLRPALAARGIATALVLGAAALLALGAVTDGGFYRHIFLYNVNRFEPLRLLWIAQAAGTHALLVGIAALAAVRRLVSLRAHHGGWSAMRRAAGNTPADGAFVMILAYAGFTTAMLLLVGKSGSSINYFIEWMCVLGLLAAMAFADVATQRSSLRVGLPVALTVQALMLPLPPYASEHLDARAAELTELERRIAAADKPVISDDMVLLIRSGRDVLWEPAIFAELASTGVWNEAPFVQKVRAGDFAFFVTFQQRGADRFDERYNPAVAQALDATYPRKSVVAGLTVHTPR